MPALGVCLSRYWEMKKLMAGPPGTSAPSDAKDATSGVDVAGKQDRGSREEEGAITTTDENPTPAFLSCEPAHVRLLMKVLRPYVLGMSLAGAGGGGFLVCVLRDPLGPPSEWDKMSSNNAMDIGALQTLVGQCVPGAYISRVAVDEEGLRVEVVEG